MMYTNSYYVNVALGDTCNLDCLSGYYDITITENIDDIVAYLYEKRFGVPYCWSTWQFQKGAKEFVSGIEDDWAHNRIDTLSLYQDRGMVSLASRNKADELADWLAKKAADYTDDEDDDDGIEVTIDDLDYYGTREIER